jgi:TRAP-type uncharacterized transport system substrate-binding protein
LGNHAAGIPIALILAVAAATPVAAAERETTVTIASGRPGGLYHPVAGAICKLVNEKTDAHGITCTVEFGVGSVTNIEAMRDGEVTLAIAATLLATDEVDAEVSYAITKALSDGSRPPQRGFADLPLAERRADGQRRAKRAAA